MRSICPVCTSTEIRSFLLIKSVPTNINRLLNSREEALLITRGDLDLVYCETCGLVFNAAFHPLKVHYNCDYEIEPCHSPRLNKHLEELSHYLVFQKGVRNSRIVEVGCGSGSFLRRMIEITDSGNTGCGFDISYSGPTVDFDGRLVFRRHLYSLDCKGLPVDVLICRHVIEHVHNPIDFLLTMRDTLVSHPNVRLFFETPCVEWTLRQQAYWNLFYEHSLYFNASSLATAFTLAGFHVSNIQHIYSGEYLWLEATIARDKQAVPTTLGSIPHLTRQFSRLHNDFLRSWNNRLQKLLSQKENIAVWGAGGTGTTFVNFLDPECQKISCVVDINPKKQGTYMAGTGHSIIDYKKLGSYSISYIIVANPNYLRENSELLRDANLENIKLVSAKI
jgi:hypothetical protein